MHPAACTLLPAPRGADAPLQTILYTPELWLEAPLRADRRSVSHRSVGHRSVSHNSAEQKAAAQSQRPLRVSECLEQEALQVTLSEQRADGLLHVVGTKDHLLARALRRRE